MATSDPADRKPRRKPGGLAAEILEVLGESAEALTPGEVLNLLPPGLSYSAVVTTLTRLYEKEVVTRERSGRAYRYRATGDQTALVAWRMGRMGALRASQMTLTSARPATDGHDQLTRLLERRRVQLVHVMPTLGLRGQILNHEFRNRLAWAIADREALVIDDVSNAPLAFDPPPPPLAAYADAPNMITTGRWRPCTGAG